MLHHFILFLAVPCSMCESGIKPMPWAVRVRSTNHWTARDVPVKGHACWNLRISPSFVNPAELRKNNDTSICSPPALEIPEGKTLSLFFRSLSFDLCKLCLWGIMALTRIQHSLRTY